MIRLPKLTDAVTTYVGTDTSGNLIVHFDYRAQGQGIAVNRVCLSQHDVLSADRAERVIQECADGLARRVGRRLVFGE